MRFLALAVILVSFNGSASTIVVSDIDDTIRHSNVRNLHKLTVLKQAEFSGLSKLYRELAKVVKRFEYVSGVPQQVRQVSEFFIYWNMFPEGRLFARNTKFDTVAHKTAAIELVIRENVPTKILMFGDNGEKDHVIYQSFDRKYPGLTDIFMHQLYDVEIPREQTPYLTSIDLTLALYSRGYISEAGLEEVLTYASEKMLSKKKKDREEFFPPWAQCRLYFQNYSRPDVQLRSSVESIVRKYESFLLDRCS